jgi:type II secretory ATPase GspE/PulE/Tfp pilus assembly ATPase PilB-like protein
MTSSRIRALCMQQSDSAEIRTEAVRQGMQTLRQNGWQRVLAGETSMDELIRVCPLDTEGE